jgi:hypothetical protein
VGRREADHVARAGRRDALGVRFWLFVAVVFAAITAAILYALVYANGFPADAKNW